MSSASSGGEVGREGGDFAGRGGPRGGGGVARYPAQASWTDPRGTQVMYMHMHMYTCIHCIYYYRSIVHQIEYCVALYMYMS